MDFNIPQHVKELLTRIDAFIEAEIKPLQAQDDNDRFFDHRREHARTNWDKDGLPREEWDRTSHTLIFHGRRVCFARKPGCEGCGVADVCPSAHKAENVGRKPPRAPRKAATKPTKPTKPTKKATKTAAKKATT